MRADMELAGTLPDAGKRALWIAIVTATTVLFSLGLACAMPLAAVAVIAGTRMSRMDGVLLVGCAWLANQAVGFGLLNYPVNLDALAWGAVMLVATLLAMQAASWTRRFALPFFVELAAALVAAFVVYEIALFAATSVLSGGDAFAPGIVAWIFGLNALALALLTALYAAGTALGFAPRAREVAAAA